MVQEVLLNLVKEIILKTILDLVLRDEPIISFYNDIWVIESE